MAASAPAPHPVRSEPSTCMYFWPDGLNDLSRSWLWLFQSVMTKLMIPRSPFQVEKKHQASLAAAHHQPPPPPLAWDHQPPPPPSCPYLKTVANNDKLSWPQFKDDISDPRLKDAHCQRRTVDCTIQLDDHPQRRVPHMVGRRHDPLHFTNSQLRQLLGIVGIDLPFHMCLTSIAMIMAMTFQWLHKTDEVKPFQSCSNQMKSLKKPSYFCAFHLSRPKARRHLRQPLGTIIQKDFIHQGLTLDIWFQTPRDRRETSKTLHSMRLRQPRHWDWNLSHARRTGCASPSAQWAWPRPDMAGHWGTWSLTAAASWTSSETLRNYKSIDQWWHDWPCMAWCKFPSLITEPLVSSKRHRLENLMDMPRDLHIVGVTGPCHHQPQMICEQRDNANDVHQKRWLKTLIKSWIQVKQLLFSLHLHPHPLLCRRFSSIHRIRHDRMTGWRINWMIMIQMIKTQCKIEYLAWHDVILGMRPCLVSMSLGPIHHQKLKHDRTCLLMCIVILVAVMAVANHQTHRTSSLTVDRWILVTVVKI